MESRHKNILIGILLAIVFVMSIGYAAFAQSLSITGTTSIDSKWDVHMTQTNSSVTTDLEMNVTTYDGVTTNGTITVADNGLTATVSATLVTPGDKVTFTIPIVNEGTINAKLNDTNGVILSQTESTDATLEINGYIATTTTGNLKFTVIPPSTDNILSANGGTTAITIVAEYIDIPIENGGNSNAYGESASLTITMNYVQTS